MISEEAVSGATTAVANFDAPTALSSDAPNNEIIDDWQEVKVRHSKEKNKIMKNSPNNGHSTINASKLPQSKFNSSSKNPSTRKQASDKGKSQSLPKPSGPLRYVPPPPPLIEEELIERVELSSSESSSETVDRLMKMVISSNSTEAFDFTGHFRYQPRGLLNNSCACFRNAVLQALLSLGPLARSLLKCIHESTITESDLSPPLSGSSKWMEFFSFLLQFFKPQESVSHSKPLDGKSSASSRLAAVDVSHYLPAIIRSFQASVSSGLHVPDRGTTRTKPRQEDAMEFLTFLLDALHEELVSLSSSSSPSAAAASSASEGSNGKMQPCPPESISLDGSEGQEGGGGGGGKGSVLKESEGQGQGGADEWNVVAKKKSSGGKVSSVVDDSSRLAARKAVDSSLVSRLFHGTLRSEVMYKVKKVNSITYQRFHCLTLDVQNRGTASGSGGADSRRPSLSLAHCLDAYFREEVLVENEIHKQLRCERLPPVLILQIGRFAFDYTRNIPVKVHAEVEYPACLEIPESYLSADCSSGKVRYALSSVILHHGLKATGGHYSAHCKELGSNTWRNFNDTKVRVLLPGEELAATETVTRKIFV